MACTGEATTQEAFDRYRYGQERASTVALNHAGIREYGPFRRQEDTSRKGIPSTSGMEFKTAPTKTSGAPTHVAPPTTPLRPTTNSEDDLEDDARRLSGTSAKNSIKSAPD